MQNWYCLCHFPDGTERVHLVPGPAPVYGTDRIIKICDNPGFWCVLKSKRHLAQALGADFAAEIWVRPATDEEIRHQNR